MPRAARCVVFGAFIVSLAIAVGGTLPVRADLAAQSAARATIDPMILKAFQWRSIGPDRGGRSIASAGVKGQPNVAYFGAVGGGLWKTTDRGDTWAPVTDGQIRSGSVGAVAVSDSNPDIVFIGMGESCIRGNIQPGDGVYKSTDAGKTWTHVGFPTRRRSREFASTRPIPNIVFVASFGKYGVPSDERGVFKSTDGGKTWQRKLFRDSKTGAVDLWIDRKNPSVIYARALGGLPRRIPDVERRTRQRPLQIDRRRRHLEGDHAQSGASAGTGRPDRRVGVGRRLQPRLRARSRTKTAGSSCPTMRARPGS